MVRAALALVAVLLLTPFAASAHPHVFVDAGARFVVDAEGRLLAVVLEHRYDPLVSLFLLQDLGIDPFAPLSPADAARMAEAQAEMLGASGAFAALAVDGADVALAAPADISIAVEDERLQVRFTAPLAAPVAIDGRAATLDVFDPYYFIAFDLTGPVGVEGTPACSAAALPWEATVELLSIQSGLRDLPPDQTPADPGVGRLFAARARLTCP